MSFGDAFQYPFSNSKFNKILQIALVFGILSALQSGLSLEPNATFGIAIVIGAIGGILFALFLSGYGTFVIKSLVGGDSSLPEFQIGDSVGRGFKIFLASLVYLLPVIIFMVIIFAVVLGPVVGEVYDEILLGLNDPYYTPSSSSNADVNPMFGLIMCGAMLVFVPLTLMLSYALQIGMVRFAIEDRSSALWEFRTNIKMVTSNLGKVIKLALLQLGIGIVFFFITAVITFVWGMMAIALPSALLLVGLTIFNVVVQYFSTANQLSNLHLLAGFATESGLAGKPKNDEAYAF